MDLRNREYQFKSAFLKCNFMTDGTVIHVYHWRYICNQLSLLWRNNGCDSVSNHQPQDCLLNRLFRRRSKKTSKLRVTGLCAGNSPVTGEFPAQMASNAENVSIWWRHYVPGMIRVINAGSGDGLVPLGNNVTWLSSPSAMTIDSRFSG